MSQHLKIISFDGIGSLIDARGGQRRVLEQFPSVRSQGDGLDRLIDRREEIEREMCAQEWQNYAEILSTSFEEATREVLEIPVTPSERRAFGASLMGWPAWPEVGEELRRWSQQMPLALLAHGEDLTLRLMAHKHFRAPMHLVVSSEQLRSYKPATKHWGALLAATGLAPEEILHVGADVELDLRPAASLGIRVAWVRRSKQEAPADLQPDFLAEDLNALGAMLDLHD